MQFVTGNALNKFPLLLNVHLSRTVGLNLLPEGPEVAAAKPYVSRAKLVKQTRVLFHSNDPLIVMLPWNASGHRRPASVSNRLYVRVALCWLDDRQATNPGSLFPQKRLKQGMVRPPGKWSLCSHIRKVYLKIRRNDFGEVQRSVRRMFARFGVKRFVPFRLSLDYEAPRPRR